MRIALFTETFLPKVDGIVTRLSHTVDHLQRNGDQVLVVCPEGGMTEYTYTYECDFQNYSIAFRNRKDNKFQMAVASYNTDSMNNQVDIIDLNFKQIHEQDGFKKINEFKHEFPPTKIMWIPDVEGSRKDILATTAEYLRVWEVQNDTNTFKEHKILRNVSEKI